MKKMTKEEKKEPKEPKVVPCYRCRFLLLSDGRYICSNRRPMLMDADRNIVLLSDGRTDITEIEMITLPHSTVRGCEYGEETRRRRDV